MPGTRRYTIEIKDVEARATMLFAAADWTEKELRLAIAQSMRLAGLPSDSALTAPTSRSRAANDEEDDAGS